VVREIRLLRGQVTLVDDEDYEALQGYRWRCSTHGYAVRSENVDGYERVVTMHRQILDAPRGLVVDHIDGNRLNNTRANLRLATQQQNLRNRGVFRNNQVKIKGVTAQHGKWHARLQFDRQLLHLGFYDDPQLAALAYDAAARLLFGPFAQLNHNDMDYRAHPERDYIEDRVEAYVFTVLARPWLDARR
jgi:hypothetical protein